MNSSQHNEPGLGISLGDIYFVIFRHKWKILLLAVAGLAAAAVFYHFKRPPFQSDAKLLVRYISDSRTELPIGNNSQVTPVIDPGRAALNSEVEILTSFDLAKEVATNFGPDRILSKFGGGSDPIAAASIIANGLNVDIAQDSSVIHLTLKNRDPDLVQPLLSEIIKDYLDMHIQVHRSAGISDELLTEETTQLKLQIAQTEAELQAARTSAGIINIADSQKAYSDEIARIRGELNKTEVEIAERQAVANQLAGKPASSPPAPSSDAPAVAASTNAVPPDQLQDYRDVCSRLNGLEKRQDDYLSKQGYTEENKLVKEVRGQITQLTKSKTALEIKYPSLVESDVAAPVFTSAPASAQPSEGDSLLGLSVRMKALKDQLAQVQADAAKLGEAEIKIADLERKQEIQEKDYSSFADSLDQARINENLGPGQVSDIKPIQEPTPPYQDTRKLKKALAILSVAGLFAGLAWAFLIELYLDNTIKRPVDIQSRLRMPLFLTVPDLQHNGHRRIAMNNRRQITYNGAANGEPDAVQPNPEHGVQITTPWVVDPDLRSYSDALRDRLVGFFESINLTRTPKLVAVTAAHRGSGVSTIAAGLAASLSETGDGRVLLVDMNVEQGAVQQFLRGKPGCKLDDALEGEKRESAMVQENLYVVAENSVIDQLPRALPKRFASLVPKLRASDYDYIIFDMPPVSPVSVTARLAMFMDKVLLVVESEKTDRNIVRQAGALLNQSKAPVSIVLNKTRNYVPKRLSPDFNSEA